MINLRQQINCLLSACATGPPKMYPFGFSQRALDYLMVCHFLATGTFFTVQLRGVMKHECNDTVDQGLP